MRARGARKKWCCYWIDALTSGDEAEDLGVEMSKLLNPNKAHTHSRVFGTRLTKNIGTRDLSSGDGGSSLLYFSTSSSFLGCAQNTRESTPLELGCAYQPLTEEDENITEDCETVDEKSSKAIIGYVCNCGRIGFEYCWNHFGFVDI